MPDRLTRRTVLQAALATPALALPANAAPRPYALDPSAATIRFTFDLNGIAQSGTAPLQSADIRLDPQNLSAAQAEVTADLTRARTGLIFATDAMKSASVLDTARHPLARFRSTRVVLGRDGRISNGAILEGRLSLRGVTREIAFDARLYRLPGTVPDDLTVLDIRLTGAIARSDFGATGFADLVADTVGLDITAKIRATSP